MIIEPIIRPPAEADSFLLQITTGCSSNHCTFCGAYLHKPFGIKPVEEVFRDIEDGAGWFPDTRRVFLLDGDALAVRNENLLPVLDKLNQSFPKLSRISSYANGYNLTQRSDEQLKELYERRLRLLYIGLESGSQAVLDRCRKRARAREMVEAVRRAASAGIKSSVIVLLGLGGRAFSQEHVRDTIRALNDMQPRYLSFLSVMLIPGTALFEEAKRGTFAELTPKELLREMRDILDGLELEKTVFRSNHASNFLALEGRLPEDKTKMLARLDSALHGKIKLRPGFLRGL